MSHTGTIRLFRVQGAIARKVAAAIYYSVSDRKGIISKWQNDYDKNWGSCFFIISPLINLLEGGETSVRFPMKNIRKAIR